MEDIRCITFLRWALPRLRLRWEGFRKVRRQVCKRVSHRARSLGLADISEYQSYLELHPEEWGHLDTLCWIPISRFYRDRGTFEFLAAKALPGIAEAALAAGSTGIRAWSAGCCGGEEPYTLMLLWRFSLQPRFPNLELQVLATDADGKQLERAGAACYSFSSLKELPAVWREKAFEKHEGNFCLRPEYRTGIRFQQQDIRLEMPDGPFEIVLCRNLAFTYFDDTLQAKIGQSLYERIVAGGVLVLGRHEALPASVAGFNEIGHDLRIYRRRPE